MTKRLPFFLIFILLFFPLVAIETVTAQENKAVKIRTKEKIDAPITGEVILYRASYALVIGIDRYKKGWPILKNSVKDAKLVANALKEKGFEVTLRTNLNSNALEQVVEDFFILKGSDSQSRLLIWFSGHGHTLDGEGFLVPMDAPNPDKEYFFRLKALSVRRFREYSLQAKSKHILMIFDSCFSDASFNSLTKAKPPLAITSTTTFPVRQFLFSGNKNQNVSDDSTFRKLFINAIKNEENADFNNDGYLTASELGFFIQNEMINRTKNKQTPLYGKLPDFDKGDFTFLYQSELPKQLFSITKLGDIKGIKNLLEKGVSINARDKNGRTPLFYAISHGFKEIEEFLISKGATISEKSRQIALAQFWIGNGDYFFEQKEYTKAKEYFDKALTLYEKAGSRNFGAKVLNNIGMVYNRLSQYNKAIEYYEKGLTTSRAVGDQSGEEIILSNLGDSYRSLRQYKQSIEYYKKALSIIGLVGNRSRECTILNNLGHTYSKLNQYGEAIKYYENALLISREIGDRTIEGIVLNNLGRSYNALNKYKKAIEYYEEALAINRILEDKFWESTILNNLGEMYNRLSKYNKAIEYFENALTSLKEAWDFATEQLILSITGLLVNDDIQYDKILEYYEQFPSIGDIVREGKILSNLGSMHYNLGQYDKALGYFEQALKISRKLGDQSIQGTIMNNFGQTCNKLSKYQKALEYFKQALPIMKEVENRSGECIILKNMMTASKGLGKTSLSIFYGKQAVIVYHSNIKNIKGVGKDTKKDDQKSIEDTYRELAILLAEQGRMSEAQQNLNLLKREEYVSFVRGDTENVIFGLSEKEYFTRFERKWKKKYEKVMSKISETGAKYHALRRKKSKTKKESKQMQALEQKLEKARQAANDYMINLSKAFEKYEKRSKSKKYEKIALAESAHAIQPTLEELDEEENVKSAILHYIVLGDQVIIIVTTPYFQLFKRSEIAEEELTELIVNFKNKKKMERMANNDKRAKVKYISPDCADINKSLYDAVFKPVDDELKKYGATNLMIYLDGVLRYLPLPALWDGENYLVQKYRMTMFTLSSLDKIKDEPEDEKRILGFGASQGSQDFPPIPFAKEEIESIVKDGERGCDGLIKGKAFIDKDFTAKVMETQLKYEEPYPNVHIASHFKFSPGDESKSYLLLGDGNIMTLSDIRLKGNLFYGVELLVLSACQTGQGGNGEEIDGFGELAQQCGAKSVVATLWPVVDESTKELMVKFYRILKEGKVTSKIEALRLAQLELAGLPDLLGKGKKKAPRSKSKYSHPYYWGPFIMIGNWR